MNTFCFTQEFRFEIQLNNIKAQTNMHPDIYLH